MEQKKTGVATYHYSFNEGAILQAFSTTQLIKKYLGDAGEIIDQRYPGKLGVYGEADSARKQALQDAIDNWLPSSSSHFRATEDLDNIYQFINREYSRLIIGSDVVWNLRYRRHLRSLLGKGIFPHQPYSFFTPYPNLYWPSKELQIPTYSYAAAIGTLEYDQIPQWHRRKMKTNLQQLRLISVRDERTRRFIESIDTSLGEKAEIVPDPTLGFDFKDLGIDQASLKERLISLGVDFNKPRVCIISKDDSEIHRFCEKMQEKGYQTIGLTTPNSMTEVELFNEAFHPLEWSVIFSFFDFVVTERMHGAIFCLKNLTPFIVIDINETKVDNDSKTVSLMRRFDLLQYRVAKSEINYSTLLSLFDELNGIGGQQWREKVEDGLEKCYAEAKSFFLRISND